MAIWKHIRVEDDPTCVAIVAHIRKNETGEVRLYESSARISDEDGLPHAYIWMEGNYSRDCNRAIFFGDSPVSEDMECSDGKYSVNLENPVDGQVFYREFV